MWNTCAQTCEQNMESCLSYYMYIYDSCKVRTFHHFFIDFTLPCTFSSYSFPVTGKPISCPMAAPGSSARQHWFRPPVWHWFGPPAAQHWFCPSAWHWLHICVCLHWFHVLVAYLGCIFSLLALVSYFGCIFGLFHVFHAYSAYLAQFSKFGSA